MTFGARAAIATAIGLACACSTAPPLEEIPSAETYYNNALEVLNGRRVMLFFHDVDYDKATELFQEVIDNYPYSEYATLAELKIADIYYDQERFEEAQSYYQDFVELHPKNAAVPYAIYRNGLCSYERLRDADRDQTPTRDAIAQFLVLLERYPESEYGAPARDMLRRSEDRLADHDVHVGDYYMSQQRCHSALGRYQDALIAYPQHTRRLETMARMGKAFRCLDRTEQAIGIYRQVLQQAAEPELAETVSQELTELGVRVDLPGQSNGRPWWRPF